MNVSKRKVRYSHFECRHDEDVDDDDEKRDRIGFERIEEKKKKVNRSIHANYHSSFLGIITNHSTSHTVRGKSSIVKQK
jgi:hypothetical protein